MKFTELDDPAMPIRHLTPSTDQRERYRNVRVTPEQGASYAHSMLLPANWHELHLEAAPVGTQFVGLSAFSPVDPPMPPITISVGVRITDSTPTVLHYLTQYCHTEKLTILKMRPFRYAVGNVVEALLMQESALGRLKIRAAMFEDGGRLFALSAMAPEALYLDVVRDMSLALVSFALVQPHGSSIPLAAS